MKLFGVDSIFYKSITKITDILLLNFLWLIASIPIVTIGASTTAAYYVAMKMVKDEEGYIARTFWKEFKSSFKKSTSIWFVMAFLGAMLYCNYALLGDLKEAPMSLFFVTIFGTFFYCVTFLAVFPLTARYENNVKQTIKNSLFITIRHFVHTVAMLAVVAVFVLIFWFNYFTMFFGVILGPGFIIFVASSFYLKIFEKVEENKAVQEKATEEFDEEKKIATEE